MASALPMRALSSAGEILRSQGNGWDIRKTIRQLEKRLERNHSFNRERVEADLERAKKRQGQTVFDWLIEVIENHGEGGDEPEDLIELILA